jgi:hypothetical protein
LPSYENKKKGKHRGTKEQGRMIDENGRLLDWPWPVCVDTGEPVQFDLLLLTANDPEISRVRPNHPDVATIAGAWNAAASKYATRSILWDVG